MSDAELDRPHRRRNLLTGDWVLVSPHRTSRPWQGHEGDTAPALPRHDPNCYLCPGNERAGGVVNPDYDGVYIFDNDFPALLDETIDDAGDDPLFVVSPVRGRCQVICYGPRHDQPLHHMPHEDMVTVMNAWIEQSETLGKQYEWVQIFENRGALMGASSPHPHGQIWALDVLPTEGARELEQQTAYRQKHGRGLLEDYLARELEADVRIVEQTEHWVALVPFWAVWPFETLVLPRRVISRLTDLSADETADGARLFKALLNRYDRLFDAPMSFSFGWHSAPSSLSGDDDWQLHAHVYPPALRSATVPKFMVGFELLGEKQRDITPEEAARRLRAC